MTVLVCTLFIALVAGSGLTDNPIVGDKITYLDGQWTATAPGLGLTINATVPGDLITDLFRAGQIEEPLYELNWKNASLWNQQWNYKVNFTVENGTNTLLVFDGVKMGAEITVNGKMIGIALDQFLRYAFQLNPKHLLQGENTLEVIFYHHLPVQGRFMGCSGGWDWAPYSNTFQLSVPGFARTFTKGIWKSVYLVTVSSVAVTDVVPQVFYTGTYPTEPLVPGKHADFIVNVRTYFWAASAVTGTFKVMPQFNTSSPTEFLILIPAGNSSVTIPINATAKDIKLWWPVGLGPQSLYNITVQFIPNTTATPGKGNRSSKISNINELDNEKGNSEQEQDGVLSATRRFGFRFFALVTGNDTDPGYVKKNANADGTDNHGMYFRVNGAAIYSRGANMIPMDEMEGRYNATAIKILVQSAIDGGMNTLRVWGGGIFQPDVFYDTCDELGMLIYHDMQFAQEGHSPSETPVQEAEFRHQIRRLSHHPSIVIWDGCNECHVVVGTSTGIYATFVLAVVENEDMSRVIWPSCPASGWSAGVNRLSALPNGSPLGLLPKATPTDCDFIPNRDVQNVTGGNTYPANDKNECCAICWQDFTCTAAVYSDGTCYTKVGGVVVDRDGATLCQPQNKPPGPTTIETHGPYPKGSGFSTTNGDQEMSLFDPQLPIPVNSSTPIGLQYTNVFTSEMGCSVFSSFESLSATLDPSHWSLHGGMHPDVCFEKNICIGGNPMSQRNHPCDNIITIYFGPSDHFNLVGEEIFKKHLWQCMIGQALKMKSLIEIRRAQNQFGCLIWQLNEIWPTGGWGSIEYGTPLKGQVLGGRWKPLHYWLKKSIFTDVTASCGVNGQCFIRNDLPARTFTGEVTVNSVEFATGNITKLTSKKVDMAAGPGIVEWFNVDLSQVKEKEEILVATVTGEKGEMIAENVIPLVTPGNMTLPKAVVLFEVGSKANSDGNVDIFVFSEKVALYVTFTTLANGRFSDNAFLLLPGKRIIQFIPFGENEVDIGTLNKTLRVEHVATYMGL